MGLASSALSSARTSARNLASLRVISCRFFRSEARSIYFSSSRNLGFDLRRASERSASFEQVRDYLAKNGVTWTFARPESVRTIIDDRFQISSFPRVILLDPEGRVIESRNNALRGENLARTLDRVLPK